MEGGRRRRGLQSGRSSRCCYLLQLRRPRIAFKSGNVLFYLRSGPPIAVPVEIVEAFLPAKAPRICRS